MIRTFVLFFAFCVFSLAALPAQAALTAIQAESFVQAIPDMEALSDRMRAEGKDAVLEASVRPKAGDTEFKPYTKGTATLKEKFPSDYIILGETVQQYDFMNAEDWAATGDQVMMAYLAVKMEGKEYQALKQMAMVPPEILAKMPPKVTSQIEQARVVMKVAESVSPGDKNIVRPHISAIDGWLAREQKKMGLTTQAPATINTKAITTSPLTGAKASEFGTKIINQAQ